MRSELGLTKVPNPPLHTHCEQECWVVAPAWGGWRTRHPNALSSAGGFSRPETENSKCTGSWEKGSPGLEIRTTGHFHAVTGKGETARKIGASPVPGYHAVCVPFFCAASERLILGFWQMEDVGSTLLKGEWVHRGTGVVLGGAEAWCPSPLPHGPQSACLEVWGSPKLPNERSPSGLLPLAEHPGPHLYLWARSPSSAGVPWTVAGLRKAAA